jgi:hypothetical protein
MASGQTRRISGMVQDSLTHQPLQNASIRIPNSRHGAISNSQGRFTITVEAATKQVIASAAGYRSATIHLPDTGTVDLLVNLPRSYTTLADVTVTSRYKKYSNKNNPAVDLIRKVIANKSRNRMGANLNLSYDQYEKVRVLFDKPPKFMYNNFLLKKMKFVFDNEDSTLVPGKKLTPVYSQEVVSENYFSAEPERNKKIITGQKSTDYGQFFDMKAISATVNRLYEDIDIYNNTISAFTLQFMSPISGLGPTFYMYFIRDTLEENDEKLVELYFTPRNPEDLLLQGVLYITLDGNYAVRKVDIEMNKHTNVNYLRSFKVHQDFEKSVGGKYHLRTSDMIAYFSPFPRTPGIFGERVVTVTNLADSAIPASRFKGLAVDSLPKSSRQTDSFWTAERPVPLTEPEIKNYSNVDSLVKMPSYNRLVDYTVLLTAGYKSFGTFELGPVGTFYSFNSVEGSRIQVGGRTLPKLSTRYFGEGFVGYGFLDMRWKYLISGTYSLNNRSIYQFPFEYVQTSYLHDLRNLGTEDVFSQGNTFLTSFNRGINDMWVYSDILRLSYVHEFENHFSYNLGFKYWQQQPAGSLAFIYETPPGKYDSVEMITTSEFSVTLRYAPHEQFYQGKQHRRSITNKYPVITFQYARGIEGLFGGQYNYNAFFGSFYKRFYEAPLGFTDFRLSAGILTGVLPYPLLVIHPANQSYFYSGNAYNVMKVGEFVSDHYAGLNVDHYFNGFFLNKIPLIKKLRLREVVTAKLLFGGLRQENNPAFNPQQMKFPTSNGVQASYILDNGPYFEAGLGIYNIFSFLRIDFIERFSYLYHPNVNHFALVFSTNLNF